MTYEYMYFFPGTVTDGEFCSLRSRGETRPLHLWQIIHDARDSIGKMSKATLLNMLELIYGKRQGRSHDFPKGGHTMSLLGHLHGPLQIFQS